MFIVRKVSDIVLYHSTPCCLLTVQLFGCGSVAQVTTSKNSKGEYLSINLGFALGTTFGVYVSKGVSGKGAWKCDHVGYCASCTVVFRYVCTLPKKKKKKLSPNHIYSKRSLNSFSIFFLNFLPVFLSFLFPFAGALSLQVCNLSKLYFLPFTIASDSFSCLTAEEADPFFC